MPNYSEEERKTAEKTGRSRGAVGPKALVPRIVREMADKDKDFILDFGCLADKPHVAAFESDGYNIEGHDFALPNPDALRRKHSIVYASNVLNVQQSEDMLRSTLAEIKKTTVKPNGIFIANYPLSPRYSDMNVDTVFAIIKEYFPHVVRIAGTKSVPVWLASFRKYA